MMEDNNNDNNNNIIDLTIPGTFKHKVKSVLNKAAEFSSKHMFDGSIDTVYNSDGGKYIKIYHIFYNRILKIIIILLFILFSFSYFNSTRTMDYV
jgi:hypothetical protein